MSFALKPIDRRIQKVLERKSKIFSRDTSALKPVSVGGISDELKKVQSRTTWMRWISGNENPIVILGGVAHYDEAYNLAKGFDQVYVPPNTSIQYNKDTLTGEERASWLVDENYREGDYHSSYFKPLAGVKSISSTFEGATKSLRKTIVNWTVYDLDELEILTPHFLSPGKWTMLEMGWNYDGKVFDEKLIGDKLLKNDTKFEDFSSVEDIIYKNEGDYEILTGVITNFEYSLRDDGGFDCTTTFATHGISLLDAGKDSTTYNIDTALKLSDPNNQNDPVSREVLLKNNLITTVNRLDDYFRFSCINKDNKVISSKYLGKIPFSTHSRSKTIPDTDQISHFYGEPNNWFIYSTLSSLANYASTKTKPKKSTANANKMVDLNTVDDQTLQSVNNAWVRWGWFEDNVLSKFMGYVTLKTDTDTNKTITGVEDIKLQFRSIDKILKVDAKGSEIPGDKDIKYESVRILSHSKMITSDINKFILVGRTPTLKRAEKSDTIRASHIGDFLNSMVDIGERSLKPFVIPGSLNNETGFEEGYLRNIYFNVNWLKEQLKGTQTLREGLDNILNGVNLEYQNFWDFDITGDENDTTLARIVDRNNPRYNVDNFRLSDINLTEDNNSLYSCYQFPTWTKDSIVSNMDYTVTIPSSQVAVAALSGGTLDSNQPASAKKGDINVQQFVKIMDKSFENQKSKFFKNIVKISDHFDNPAIEKFGNSSADENKKLESNEGPSILGTVVNRDKEFTNPTEGNAKTDIPPIAEIGISSAAMAHPYFANPSFTQPNSETIGGYNTLYTSTGKLQEGGSTTFKEQMLKGLHTDRRTAKTKLVDLLNGIATIKLTIDGTAGIYPGDAFTSKHLPNHLIRRGIGGALPLIFQATNVEQALGPDGWKTTITGQPRLNSKYLYEDEERTKPIGTDKAASNQKLAYFQKTRNILGINAQFMSKYKMHHGILRIHKSDPYWGGGDMKTDWSTEFPLRSAQGNYTKNIEPNVKFTSKKKAEHKESYYMAIYNGISVQKAMWLSMYSAILYGIPPEQSYRKTFDPFLPVDGFNLMSYLMFVSDDLDPINPVKRYMDSGKHGWPKYTDEFFTQINKHFKDQDALNKNVGGTYTDYYSPLQWITKETLTNKRLPENYQQLFRFTRIEPKERKFELPGNELFDKDDMTCVMRLTETGRDIYKAFFKMLYKAWIGDDFEENVSLTANNKNIDESKIIREYGKMFRNSGAGGYDQAVDDLTTESIDESELFKGSNIHTFNFDDEVDKFLTMMTKHGIIIAPGLTMRFGGVQTSGPTGLWPDYNAWDVIQDTVAKHKIREGLTGGNNLKIKHPLDIGSTVTDKEIKEINLKTTN